MNINATYNGAEQSIDIPEGKKTCAQVTPIIAKAFKLAGCSLVVAGKILVSKDAITEGMTITVKDAPKIASPPLKEGPKEGGEEYYEVEYEYEDSSSYGAGDKSD